MAFGEKDSETTSAHRTRSSSTSRPTGFDGSTVRLILPVLKLANGTPFSTPGSPSRNAGAPRPGSSRTLDSTLITVAP